MICKDKRKLMINQGFFWKKSKIEEHVYNNQTKDNQGAND